MDWTEDAIRKQVDWRAWKEGKALVERRAAASVRRQPGILTATFGEGRRRARTVVKLGDRFEPECTCPTFRGEGRVCAHAVALALLSLAPGPGFEPRQEQAVVGETFVRRVLLPPAFPSMLAKGQLALRLEACDDPVAPADESLSRWLHQAKAADTGLLSIDAERLGGFMDAIAGHPRVFRENDGRPVRVRDERMPPCLLADSERTGDGVRLRLAEPAAIRWFAWGGELAEVVERAELLTIGRLPVESPPPGWVEEALRLARAGDHTVGEADFLAGLDAWLDLFASPAPGWLGDLHLQAILPRFRLELEGSLNALDARVTVAYPDTPDFPLGERGAVPGLPRLGDEGQVIARHRQAERLAERRLESAGLTGAGEPGRFRMRDADAILDFVANQLPELQRDWEVRLGDRLKHVLAGVHVVRGHVDLPDEMSLSCEISFQTDAGKRVPADRIRGLLRTGRRAAKIANGATLVVAREVPELMEPLLADLGMSGAEGRHTLDAATRILFQNLRENTSKPITTNPASISVSVSIEALIQAHPRPYQVDGIRWMLGRLQDLRGVLLADEMGLGKTLQTIACMSHLSQADHRATSLVVVPASLLANWQEELARFAPKMTVVTLHGSGRDRHRDAARGADVVLTSYGTLTRDRAFHLKQEYALVVADEASLLRNPDSEISRTMAKLPAARRVALSGTPIENRPLDLWAIFRFVAPGYLGARTEFDDRYQAADREPRVAQRLRLRVSPFVLRRTKLEVAKDLPEKVEIDEWLDLGRDARGLYASLARSGLEEFESIQKGRGQAAARMHMLTLLLRLRQVCLDPGLLDLEGEIEAVKRERLTELLAERADSGRKTLVFSQFRQFLRRYADAGPEHIGQVHLLDGSTRNRGERVRRFCEEPGPAVFLISLKAGGYGLNLTAADAVVHMDPWWNPAVEAQASDRAHRIGQTEPVTVYRLLTRDTVEERVRRLQARKRALIDAIGSDEGIPADWSEQDLRSLLE